MRGDGQPHEPDEPSEPTGPDQDVLAFDATPRPRRSGRRGAVIAATIAVVTLLLLAVAVVAADLAAREFAREQIRSRLRTSLGIDATAPLLVDVRGTSMLQQLLTGELERVDVSSPAVTFGDLTGSLRATAAGIPLDQEQPVKVLSIRFGVDDDQLGALSANLSELPVTSVRIEGDRIRADLEFSVFGQPVPLGVGVEPSVAAGQLAFTPSEIVFLGANFSADDLRRRFGAVGEAALRTQNLCVAEYLPRAFVLDEVDLRDDDMLLFFDGAGAVLSGPDLSATGSCE